MNVRLYLSYDITIILKSCVVGTQNYCFNEVVGFVKIDFLQFYTQKFCLSGLCTIISSGILLFQDKTWYRWQRDL